MRKKVADVFLGMVIILIGILYILKSIYSNNFTIFFEGWYTLFIIIPCVYSMIRDRVTSFNLIGLVIGVLLLLSEQRIFGGHSLWEFTVPIILILIGINIIIKQFRHPIQKNIQDNQAPTFENTDGNYHENSFSNKAPVTHSTLLGSIDQNYSGREFNGAKINAVLGGVTLNLRNSIISKNCVIDVNAVLGGVDIFLPSNVKVVLNSTPILGGCDNSFISNTAVNAPIVTINSLCVLGGVDIK